MSNTTDRSFTIFWSSAKTKTYEAVAHYKRVLCVTAMKLWIFAFIPSISNAQLMQNDLYDVEARKLSCKGEHHLVSQFMCDISMIWNSPINMWEMNSSFWNVSKAEITDLNPWCHPDVKPKAAAAAVIIKDCRTSLMLLWGSSQKFHPYLEEY